MIHWLRFFRVPLLPTVWSHLYAASLIAGLSLWDHPWLIVAFSCVYLFGMGDNDRADLHRDLENNPSRPLAAGHISLTAATVMITLVLILGLVSIVQLNDPTAHQSMMVGVALVAAWGYNRRYKQFVVPGALCMAVARGSIYLSLLDNWKYAAVLAAYIFCVTVWSTTEEKYPGRKKWTLIFLLMLPILDFVLVTYALGFRQEAIYFFAVPIICRMMVLALMPKKTPQPE